MALGQEHQHATSTGVVIAHDLPPSGRTYVGNLNHFVVLYLGDDGVPDFHQQNEVRVRLNGVTVFATTEDSGHDYDGVYGFDVAFLQAGQYEVEALQDGNVKATFAGRVESPATQAAAWPNLSAWIALGSVPPGPTQSSFEIDPQVDGQRVFHSDAVVEVYRAPVDLAADGILPAGKSGALVLRTRTHTHEDIQRIEAVFEGGHNYALHAQTYRAFPSSGIDFQPATALAGFSTEPPLPRPATVLPAAGAVPENVVVSAPMGPYTLYGTFDPYNVVGPDTLLHLTVVVLDGNHTPVQHVDFTAELLGPDGEPVFASSTLHEYDGVLELDTVQAVPGAYVLQVTADRGDSASLQLPFTVSPAAPSFGQGPQRVTLDGAEAVQVGHEATWTFHVADLAGNPYQHNEMDVVIERVLVDVPAVPVLRAKLHTHASGDFPMTVTFQEPGTYQVRVSPYPLGTQAAPRFQFEQGDADLVATIAVADGNFPPGVSLGIKDDNRESPLPPVVLVLALCVSLLVRRRT